MHKYINIFGLIILMFTNHNITAADLYDIYKVYSSHGERMRRRQGKGIIPLKYEKFFN